MSEKPPVGSSEERENEPRENKHERTEVYPSFETDEVLAHLLAKYQFPEGATIVKEECEDGFLKDLEVAGGEYPLWEGESVTFWYSRRIVNGKCLINLDVCDETGYAVNIEKYDLDAGVWRELKDEEKSR
jgi:hypothetical protein